MKNVQTILKLHLRSVIKSLPTLLAFKFLSLIPFKCTFVAFPSFSKSGFRTISALIFQCCLKWQVFFFNHVTSENSVCVCVCVVEPVNLMEMEGLAALWCLTGRRFSAEQVKQAKTATGLPNREPRGDLKIPCMWTQQ